MASSSFQTDLEELQELEKAPFDLFGEEEGASSSSGGDVITYGSCVSLSTKLEASDRKLYLHTDITHSSKAYTREFLTDSEGFDPESRAGAIGNIHTIAFEIVPPQDFKARKELREELSNRKKWEEKQIDREEAWQQIVTQAKKPLDEDSQAREGIKKIQATLGKIDKQKEDTEAAIVAKTVEVGAEDEINKQKTIAQFGKPLLYGQTIQLKQVYSNKFLSISDKTVARLAYNHMGVFLQEFGGTSANFKVMPRFKIRGEGDPVRAGDQCVLLSEKASGQYLTCTAGDDGSKGVFKPGKLITHEHVFQQGDHEASASAEKRGWTIKEIFRAPPPGGKKKKKVLIQSGDVVSLQHREMEKLLASAPDGHAAMSHYNKYDIATLWQVCHHGPYIEQTAEDVKRQGAKAGGDKILNSSDRLEGGKIKKEKLLKRMGTQSITFRNVLTGQYLMRYSSDNQQWIPTHDGRRRGSAIAAAMPMNWARKLWVKAIRVVIHINREARKERVRNEMAAVRQAASSPKEEELYMDVHEGERLDSFGNEGDESVGPLDKAAPSGHYYPGTANADSHGSGEERWSAAPSSAIADNSVASPRSWITLADADDDGHIVTRKRYKLQLKLCNDSKGAGFGDMDRTAFGLVAVDATQSDFIENNGYYRIRDKKNKKGAFVHFPEKGEQVEAPVGSGNFYTPPELLEGEDSFQDVFCISKVDDGFLRDIYYVQGLSPVLQQLVQLIAPEEHEPATKENVSGLVKLLKYTRSDGKMESNIMQVGITLCKELIHFLSPLDANGAVDSRIAGNRRMMLQEFNVLEKLVRVLHTPLVGHTGPQLREAADHLRKVEFKGQSVLEELWHEALQVLSVASLDFKGSSIDENGGVKEYLVNFFRLFTLHLIYFGSNRAAHMLVAIARGSRDVCDQIVKDPEDDIAGDFRFFLSFVCLPEPERGQGEQGSGSQYISFEYFNVLKAFCTQGDQAVTEVQNMIAQALKGREPLVGRDSGAAAFDTCLLLPFEQEELGERVQIVAQNPPGLKIKSSQKKVRGGLKPDSAWEMLATLDETPYYKNKETGSVLMREPDDIEFLYSTEGEQEDKALSRMFIEKILITLELESSGAQQESFIALAFSTPAGQSPRKEWDPTCSTRKLSEICEPTNDERAVTPNEYWEPTLKDEQRFFMLESQMMMMSEISKGDNEKSREIVLGHYKKDMLMTLFKDDELCYGLRTAALKLFFNGHLNIGGIVPDGDRPQYIYRWDAPEKRENIGNDAYIESADQIHEWFVAAGPEAMSREQKRMARRAGSSVASSKMRSFKSDLEQFMQEMQNIVTSQRPWNGMNSSKRVPFHQKQGEFVLATLKVAKFITLARYYSEPGNEDKGQELLKVLRECVLAYSAKAVSYKSSMARDISRNELIDKVLTITLELVELLTFIRIERDAVQFFMIDYRFIYSQTYELESHPLPVLHKKDYLTDLVPEQCTEDNAEESWNKHKRQKCVHLTHPTENDKAITNYDKEGLDKENVAVKAYLSWLFSKGLDPKVLGNLTEVLMDLAREAPASVSLKATDLIVNLQSSQQSFFKTCAKVFVVVNKETGERWDEIRQIGQKLYQLVHNAIMDEKCAGQVLEKVVLLKQLLLNKDKVIETDFQQLCFKEGIADLLLSIMKHDLDDDQLDNDGTQPEPTVSQQMLIGCLSLLGALAENEYEPVGRLLLQELVSLLSYKNCLGPLVAANLVNAMIPVLRNIKFQAKVREVHVVALVKRMLALYDQKFFVAEFLDLLSIIADSHEGVTETSVVFQNQSTIITQLMKNGTIGEDMLEKTQRISSWTGFDDPDHARLYGDVNDERLIIRVKGTGFDASLPGIVVGDKDLEKEELVTIKKATLKDITNQDGQKSSAGQYTELELTTALTFKFKDGASVVKPSRDNMNKGVMTAAALGVGDTRVEVTRRGIAFQLKDVPAGVNVIVGYGAEKELNSVKAVHLVHLDSFGFGDSPRGSPESSYMGSYGRDETYEVEFDTPMKNQHAQGTSIIVVGKPSIKKGTLDSIKLDKQYIISLVELLAICGAGKNRYIEAICKKIIPVEMETSTDLSGGLIDVLTKKILAKKFANGLLEVHVELPRFKAYMKYLYHIYLSENCLVQIELRYPLVTNPSTWEILNQCKGEVMQFSKDVGNKEGAEPVVFENRLSLLFDVCGPYLSAVFKSHYTEDNLDIADDLQKQREASQSQRVENVLSRDECEAEFFKIAPDLIEGVTRTIVQGRHQPWWLKKHNDLLEKLLHSILENAVRHKTSGTALATQAQEIVTAELDKESSINVESTRDRTILSVGDWRDAGELSEMLKANKAFNRFIILTKRPKGHKSADAWCLHEGDDGLVTHGQHVNGSLNTFIDRLQELDSFQNRDGHECYERGSDGVPRFEACRYLEPLNDGGLPSTTQFQKVKGIFSNKLGRDTGISVILKHLGHIRDRLKDKDKLDDASVQKYYSEVTNMFNILAAILHDVTCKLFGSSELTKENEDQLREQQNSTQRIMVEGVEGDSVLLECLEFLQVPNHEVMQSAYRVFVACLKGASNFVLGEAHKALETPVGGKALQKLKTELENSLISVRDNLIKTDQMEAEKENEKTIKAIEDAKSNEMEQHASALVQIQNHLFVMVKDLLSKIRRGLSADNPEKKVAVKDGSAQKSIMNNGDKSTSGERMFEFDKVNYNWCYDMVAGIGSIVEGGHSGIRHAFREQRENSVNFITVLCTAFRILPDNVQDEEYQRKWLKLVGGVAYALSELCEGNVQNQKVSFESDVMRHMNHLIQMPHKKNYIEVAQMQKHVLSVVGAMLESNTHRDTKFAHEMANALDFVGIRSAMNSLYFLHLFDAEHRDRVERPDELLHKNAFRCYWLLRRIQDLTDIDIDVESRPLHWHDDDDDGHQEAFEKAGDAKIAEEDEMGELEGLVGLPSGDETETGRVLSDVHKQDRVLLKFFKKKKEESEEKQRKKKVEQVKNEKLAREETERELLKEREARGEHESPAGAVHKEHQLSKVEKKEDKKADKMEKEKITFDTFWEEVLVYYSTKVGAGLSIDGPGHQDRDRMSFFAAKTSSIEFVREGDLEKLYFHLEESMKMSQIYRNRVLDGLNWSTAQDKVRDFIQKFDKMKGAMKVQEGLKSKWYAVYIADGTAFRWQVAIMSLTYVINLIMMVALSLTTDIEPSAKPSSILPSWYTLTIVIAGVMHVVVSFGVVMQYFVNQSTNEGIKVLLTSNIMSSAYYLAFLGLSIGGLFNHGYCYVFHLLYVVQNNKDLGSAVQAVTHNGKSLLWVAFLTLTIVYIFSFFSFLFYREDFVNDDGMFCNSLIECVATMLANSVENGGMRDRIGPGANSGPNATGYTDSQAGRIVVDLLFWILIVTIMMNLVLGIIVDTFSQLREEQAHRDDEMTSKCFICSLPAYRFEKAGGFKKHIAHDHNMWMYLYYTIYLDTISRADRTDLQAFLHAQWVDSKNHGPFPIMRAQVLESSDKDTGDMVQGLMTKLTSLEESNRATQSRIRYMSSSLRDKIDELRIDRRTDTPSEGGSLSPARKSARSRTSSATRPRTRSSMAFGQEAPRGRRRTSTTANPTPEFSGFAD